MGRALHHPPVLCAELAAETGVIENAGREVPGRRRTKRARISPASVREVTDRIANERTPRP